MGMAVIFSVRLASNFVIASKNFCYRIWRLADCWSKDFSTILEFSLIDRSFSESVSPTGKKAVICCEF